MGKRRRKNSYKRLIVWQKSWQLAIHVMRMRRQFMEDEMFGLSPQVGHSAFQVATYIAEAFDVREEKQRLRFLNLAQVSLVSCQYYLRLAHDHACCNTNRLMIAADQVSVMLEAFIKSLRK